MAETKSTPNDPRLKGALQEQMDVFFAVEKAVQEDKDPEAIHQIRVASRRLQELLRLVLPKGKATRSILLDIGRVRRMLGDIRDPDVMIGRIQASRAKTKRADLCEGLDLMLADIKARREKTHKALCKDLSNKREIRRLQKRLERTVAKALKAGVDEEAVAARINKATERREKAFQETSKQARETQQPQALHTARIAGKKLRYALDAADMLGMGQVQDRIRTLKTIQDQLGNWNDLEVLEENYVSFCSKKDRIRKHTGALRALYGAILQGRKSKARYLDAFLKNKEEISS